MQGQWGEGMQVATATPAENEMRRRVARRDGFTLIELLIASAVFIVVILAATGLLITSTRGYAVTEAVSDRQQEVEAAVNILEYDLKLAGYRGTTPTGLTRTFDDATLVVDKADDTSSDRIVIRYYEDSERLFGATDSCGSPCEVVYEVDVGDDGTTYLYRQELNSDEVGLVQAVDLFKVRHYIRRGGERVTASEGVSIPDDVAALNIEITFLDGSLWRFPVGLSNEQEL